MKPIILAGTIIVTLALIAYTLFIITEHKQKRASGKVLLYITLGLFLDITATVCMIIGSSNTPFTLHGFLGYTSLLAMLIDGIAEREDRHEQGNDRHHFVCFRLGFDSVGALGSREPDRQQRV